VSAFLCGLFFWMAIDSTIRAVAGVGGWHRPALDVALTTYFGIAWIGSAPCPHP